MIPRKQNQKPTENIYIPLIYNKDSRLEQQKYIYVDSILIKDADNTKILIFALR